MAQTMAGTFATPSMLKSGFAAAATAVALKRFHQPVPKHGVYRRRRPVIDYEAGHDTRLRRPCIARGR